MVRPDDSLDNRTLIRLAWGLTLLVSSLPDIAWVKLAGSVPVWLPLAKMALLLALALTAAIWSPLRPLRNYCLALFAFFGLEELRPHINFDLPAVQAAPMLATLETVGGSRHALWMSAYFFGIAHYFGTPGGILGGVASIFMGWILGKGMIETRGLFWSWWIHFLSDIAIFSFLTVRLLK